MGKILAKDAIPGVVYATRGGICIVPSDQVLWESCKRVNEEYEKAGGKFRKVPWGFDRVRVIEKKSLYANPKTEYTIVEAGWNPRLELPPDYPLYETELQTISTAPLFKLSGRRKEDTIELTYDEAVEQGFVSKTADEELTEVTVSDASKDTLTAAIIVKLSTEEGATLRDLALQLNVTYQKVRYLVLKLPEFGYKLHKNDSVFRIEKR